MQKALFISPHLDDVAFSCGGTMVQLIDHGWDVTLCTIFTASVVDPEGFALRCQTDKGVAPFVDYMRLRRAEDRVYAQRAGTPRLLHLDMVEAPHRGYHSPEALFAGMRSNDRIWREVAAELVVLVARLKPDLVFAPQGLGNHVDHLQIIEAVRAAGLMDCTCWYRDTPYAIRQPDALPSTRLPKGLVERSIPIDTALETKIAGCTAYVTQIGFQFGGAPQVGEKLRAFHQAEAARLKKQGSAETLLTPSHIDPERWFERRAVGNRGQGTRQRGQGSWGKGQPDLVSVVILSYNSKEYLPRAVESVLDQEHQPVELIIVDNASTDGSAELLDQYESVATIIRQHQNTGFARGMNAGYDVSRGEYVIPMNVDAVLHPSFIREALALLRVHPDVGVIAPEVYKLYPDDEWRFWRGQQLVSDRRPTTSRATHLQSEGGVVRLTPMMRVDVPEDQPDAWRPSFKANGACPIIRRALLEQMQQRFGVAPFDPTFDTYGEDVDFAFKAWALRWRTMFARQVQAGHIRSYASPVALVDKRGRLRINLVAERYINALRHLPPDRLIPVTLRALREDAEMAIRQARRGDHEARKDVAAGLARAWRMWPDLLRFRVLHRTWQRIDFLTEVHCERPTIDDRRLATNDRPEAVDLFHTRQSRL